MCIRKSICRYLGHNREGCIYALPSCYCLITILQIEEKKCTKWFDYGIIKDNICFRTRRPGDYLCIHPDGKTQKLKSYFINEKIPQSERDDMLLVAVGSHILWIPGQRRSCKYRVTENTKYILEIHVDEGERDGTD